MNNKVFFNSSFAPSAFKISCFSYFSNKNKQKLYCDKCPYIEEIKRLKKVNEELVKSKEYYKKMYVESNNFFNEIK